MIGVYVIKCIPTGRFYIGSSDNIAKRKARHLRTLRNGTHHNVVLQRVFNKYGEVSLSWQYKEVNTVQGARALEQHYLYLHMDNPKCMNIGVHATGGDNLTNNPNRDVIIAKIREGVLVTVAAMSDEERRAAFGSPGKLNGMYGKRHSKSARKRMTHAVRTRDYSHLKGVKKSEEHRKSIEAAARLRAASPDYVNGFKGRQHTEDARKRMGEANKGRTPANVRRVRVGKKVFKSLRECASALGVSNGTICYRIQSASFPDYTYKD